MAVLQAFQSCIDGARVILFYDDETLEVDHVEIRGLPEGKVVNVTLDDGTARWNHTFAADGDATPFPTFAFSTPDLDGVTFGVSEL